jgi:hypothetical protein
MQPNALLIWQNFIIAKSGCYMSLPRYCDTPSFLFRRWGIARVMLCIVSLDQVMCYYLGSSMHWSSVSNLAFGDRMIITMGSGVKAATGNCGMAIITMGCHHSALSCRSVPRGRRADSGMVGILAGMCPIDTRSSKRLGPRCLMGLRPTSTYHAVESDPIGCRSRTRGQD